MATRRGGKMPQKKKRPVFGGQDSDAVIKLDSRNPVTARKEEAAKKAAAKKATQAKTDAAVAKRTAKQKAESAAAVKKVKTPSKATTAVAKAKAMGKAAAASPKPTRLAKPKMPPAGPKVPPMAKMDVTKGAAMPAPKMDITPDVSAPKPAGKVKKPSSRFAGRGGRKRRVVGRAMGGMMKSKMSTKGGARGGPRKFNKGDQVKKGGKFPDLTADGKVTQKDILKGRGVPGFKEGGKKGPKGYAAGGMKAKLATKKKKPTKQKVRGAGIARKGVRPAKMR